jgi:putative ABC transport system permease protein
MIKTILNSFALAFGNIRSNFFHTLLSVLGIVIGVAALVSILSLIDGMEKYAREQITETTSLKAISVSSDVYKSVNELRVRKDSFAILTPDLVSTLRLSKPAELHLYNIANGEIQFDTIVTASQIIAANHVADTLVAGTGFAAGDKQKEVTLINTALARILAHGDNFEPLIGKTITYRKRTLIIQGVFSNRRSKAPRMVFPITLLSAQELKSSPPELVVEATNVEDVPVLKKEIETQLKKQLPSYEDDINIFTNDTRVQQAAQGFLLFRVIMGLIVGISVVVGGIGVMNVLLISVTERTREIGVRKAVGANKRHIVLQFLSESITVSAFGSALGVILGVLGTLVFIPIIKAITKVPFQAAFTANTMIVIAIISILVGIIFGTYPAIRAARLDPVDAIRHE